jgi:hypothetical protein
MVKSTRLRYVSSPSAEGLELAINALPFKVEIKSIAPQGDRWWLWFVLPDNITHDAFQQVAEQLPDVEFASIELEDF